MSSIVVFQVYMLLVTPNASQLAAEAGQRLETGHEMYSHRFVMF